MKFTRISIDNRDAWNRALESFNPMPSHYWEFNQAFKDSNIELVVGEAEELEIAWPVTYRQSEYGLELLSPLGYAGPLYTGEIRSIREEWHQFWKSQGAVTGYFQLHPLLQETQKQLFEGKDARIANYNFVIELNHSEQQLRSNLARDHRARLNKWNRGDAKISTAPHEVKVQAFVSLYQQFAERRGLSNLYTFDTSVLEQMALNPNQYIVAVESAEGEIEAISLFPFGKDTAYYYLSGATETGQHHARAILWHAMMYFKKLGLQYLNLGGGIRPEDSLHSFKSRFGSTEYSTYAFKQIFDMDTYTEMCNRFDVSLDTSGYFPPWRSKI